MSFLSNPAFWAAVAALLSALGWEVDNRLVEQGLGAVAVLSAVASMLIAYLRR